VIAWLDGFRDGQRLLEAAGATPTWTKSVVKLLMRRPGSAAEFAGVVPLPKTMVGEAGWKVEELQDVIARVLRDGTATAALVRVLLERDWTYEGSPFAKCSAEEFANLVFPPDVQSIGKYAFSCCLGLTQVQIPPSVATIGWCAFEDCSSLTQVEIPPSVTRIEQDAFRECHGLTRVTLLSSATVIGWCAFAECAALTQVEIPSNMWNIDRRTFGGVRKLKRVTLVGSPLSSSVVATLEGCLMSTAKVVGAALAGQKFGRFTIAAA
jgi:hypothetical protein